MQQFAASPGSTNGLDACLKLLSKPNAVSNWAGLSTGNRNTAFCNKCLGRLKRMESEAAPDAHRQAALLRDSVRLLREAIDGFTKLELEAEVGDCYSLLARTYLVAGDRQAARDAIREADERLVDSTSKDYLDLKNRKGRPHATHESPKC